MALLRRFLPRLALAAGAALSAYGGYGAGIGQAAGGDLTHWLQVAALAAAALGMLGFGLWKAPQAPTDPAPSFAADLAALERLVPIIRRHPDGLAALQDLVDVVFEACHRPDLLKKHETLLERSGNAGVRPEKGSTHVA